MGDLGDEPDSPYDNAMLSLAIAFSIPFILANGVIIVQRKRNYFHALGGVDLIAGTSVAGIVWIAVNFVTNEHFSRRGIMGVCSLWTFWLQLPLGCCLWMMLIYLRLYRLYVPSTKAHCISSLNTWLFYLPPLLLPAIIFSTIATVYDASKQDTKEEHLVCDIINSKWKYATYLTVPPLYISLIVSLLFRLRKQTDFLLMSERRHTSESTMMAFMFYLLDAVIFVSEKQKNIAGRCFLTFCVCWLVFMDFWVRLWKPVYLCLFKPESEMKKFEDELRWCGAGFFDKLNVATVLRYTTRSICIPSSQLHDGDWVLRTMDLLFSETAECEVSKILRPMFLEKCGVRWSHLRVIGRYDVHECFCVVASSLKSSPVLVVTMPLMGSIWLEVVDMSSQFPMKLRGAKADPNEQTRLFRQILIDM